MTDEVKLLPDGENCARCGQPVSARPSETVTISTEGKIWHYGCAPCHRPPVVTDEVVERVAEARPPKRGWTDDPRD